MKTGHLVSLLIGCFMLTSCKLILEPPKGGSITTDSGAIWCGGGSTCEIPVTDTEFAHTFTAVAEPEFFFRRWRGGERTLCARSVDSCILSTQGFDSNEALMNLLASDEQYYLRPVFSRGTCIDISGNLSPIDYPISYSRVGAACPDAENEEQKHGVIEIWEDGNLVSVTRWDLGLHQGKSSIMWPNGNLRATGNWDQGRLEGRLKSYYRDGSLKEYVSYKKGIRQGPFAEFTRPGEEKRAGEHSPVLQVKGGEIVRDFMQGISWTRDANLFKTLCDAGSEITMGFQPGDAESSQEICDASGEMTWNDANLWVDHLNELNYAGQNSWRLPVAEADSTCGGGGCTDNEMGALYYNVLDNIDGQNPQSRENICPLLSGSALEAECLINRGPFTNIQLGAYWLGSQHPLIGDYHFFMFSFGDLDSDNPENRFHVWPVFSG